jgi:hypothetical protein
MSAISCPGVPFEHVVCKEYQDDTTTPIEVGPTGDPFVIYTDVNLRSAYKWCVTASLRSTLVADAGSTSSQLNVGASLYALKFEDGAFPADIVENRIYLGNQVQSVVVPSTDVSEDFYVAQNTSGMTDLSRGYYRFVASQSAGLTLSGPCRTTRRGRHQQVKTSRTVPQTTFFVCAHWPPPLPRFCNARRGSEEVIQRCACAFKQLCLGGV